VAAPEIASTAATRPVAELAAEALTAARREALAFSRVAVFHEVGLFTLHSVFRI
jgi:hypothetical protein